MPVVRKSNAQKHLSQLNESVNTLRKVLEGSEPNPNTWDIFALNEDDYSRDFMHIDPTDLGYALSALEGVIKELRKTKSLQAERLHRAK